MTEAIPFLENPISEVPLNIHGANSELSQGYLYVQRRLFCHVYYLTETTWLYLRPNGGFPSLLKDHFFLARCVLL